MGVPSGKEEAGQVADEHLRYLHYPRSADSRDVGRQVLSHFLKGILRMTLCDFSLLPCHLVLLLYPLRTVLFCFSNFRT